MVNTVVKWPPIIGPKPSARVKEYSLLAKIKSSAVVGVDALPVTVEVDITYGLPAFSTVGLPEGAVRESRERGARGRAR